MEHLAPAGFAWNQKRLLLLQKPDTWTTWTLCGSDSKSVSRNTAQTAFVWWMKQDRSRPTFVWIFGVWKYFAVGAELFTCGLQIIQNTITQQMRYPFRVDNNSTLLNATGAPQFEPQILHRYFFPTKNRKQQMTCGVEVFQVRVESKVFVLGAVRTRRRRRVTGRR